MQIISRKIAELKPYEKNAKIHPKKQIQKIAKSIKEFGFVQPLVIDKKDVIVIGHGRFEAAKLLEFQEVPCLILENLNKAQISALRLADNKLNESEWDMELVIAELKELDLGLLEITGFDQKLVLESDPKDDVVPELPEEPKSKLGELYQLGRHRLLCGDSTALDQVAKLMNGQKADMVFTDPPYNIDYDFSQNGMVQTGQRKAKFGKIKNDAMSDDEFNNFITGVFTNLREAMKEGASYYISAGLKSTQTFNRILTETGFKISQWLIWFKEHFNISRLSYHPCHEIITYGWKRGGGTRLVRRQKAKRRAFIPSRRKRRPSDSKASSSDHLSNSEFIQSRRCNFGSFWRLWKFDHSSRKNRPLLLFDGARLSLC